MFTEKKYLKLISIAVLGSSCIPFSLFSQDIHFSQFREAPLLTNPAQTGINKDIRVIINYKNQWSTVTSPYKTYAFSGEYAFNQVKSRSAFLAVGLQFYNDKAGDSKMGTTQALLALNGIVKMGEKQKISLGLIGGWAQRSIDYNALKWESQYDGNNYNPGIYSGESFATNSFNYADFGAGLAWSYGKEQKYISAKDAVNATIGFSAFHFGLTNYSYSRTYVQKLDTKLIGHANMEIGLAKANTILTPEFIYVNQGSLSEINGGVLIKFLLKEQSVKSKNIKASAFALGIHHRYKDAVIGSILYEYANYAIGISYDINTSALSASSKYKGGVEIALRFVTPNPHQKRSSSVSF